MQIDIEFNSGAQLPMDAIPALAQMAEAHGFGCAWGGEANNKDPTVMLAASVGEIREKIKAYRDAGATRIILPYVSASEDIVGETRNFISLWGNQET